jgi:hypothetical protein
MPLTDQGAAVMLARTFVSGQDYTLRLHTNNYTTVDGSISSSYTEAAGGGYAAKTLSGASWTHADDGAGIRQASYAAQTFTFTGPLTGNATIYGYYILDASNNVMCGDLLPAPFTPASNGDNQQVTVIVKLSKGTPT